MYKPSVLQPISASLMATSQWNYSARKTVLKHWSCFFGFYPTVQADNGSGDYLANADQNVADYPIHPDLLELSI